MNNRWISTHFNFNPKVSILNNSALNNIMDVWSFVWLQTNLMSHNNYKVYLCNINIIKISWIDYHKIIKKLPSIPSMYFYVAFIFLWCLFRKKLFAHSGSLGFEQSQRNICILQGSVQTWLLRPKLWPISLCWNQLNK